MTETRTALKRIDAALARKAAGTAPACSFGGFLADHARVRTRTGAYAGFSFTGRRPLRAVADLIDAVIRNTVDREAVEVDGVRYAPGALKGASIAVAGGAQFGKTVLELNLIGYGTTCKFLNCGYYTSDRELLATIVDTKFRPDVVDQIPWLAGMVQLDKAESKSGKAVNRKNAFQVSDGKRKAFGYFNGMQRPPTTITLDLAILDEVDDIPERNIGFISGRMTNSDVQLTIYIGTQRVHAAGQNARFTAGTMHTWRLVCPDCRADICLEDNWPGVCRIDTGAGKDNPKLSETTPFDTSARYYPACPDCGAELDPDAGRYVAERPDRAGTLTWSFRISQMSIPAIAWRDIVAAWFAALADPNPQALAAWHCDRHAIPHAGAAQPITPETLSRASAIGLSETIETEARTYSMALVADAPGSVRAAGMDMGPRSWLWVNEIRSPAVSALVWAEMIPSGRVAERCADLRTVGAFDVLFMDAGGEPELTKAVVMMLNGLDTWTPPAIPANELVASALSWPNGLAWNPGLQQWRGLKAAAVDFSQREGIGLVQTIGRTQDGRVYPLLKANRGETIQAFVNDFLTPSDGVLQQVAGGLRTMPRQRLPANVVGPGVTAAMLATHLQNLRKIRPANNGPEEWADGVENHLGLAGAYARLAALVGATAAAIGTGVSAGPRAGEPREFDRRAMTVPVRGRVRQ